MKKIILTLLLLTSIHVQAAEPLSMFVQYAQNVRIYITNEECKKWKAPEGYQLNFAYAVNTDTGEKITGCYTHDDKNIIIQLTDDVDHSHYEYLIGFEHFQVPPTL